jgi:hypothetical protein
MLVGMIDVLERKYGAPASPMDPISWIVIVRCKNFRIFSLYFPEEEIASRAAQILDQLAFPGLSMNVSARLTRRHEFGGGSIPWRQ